MSAPTNLTPTQRRLFDILSDGEWHHGADLLEPVTGRRFACDHLIPVHVNRLKGRIKGVYAIRHEKGPRYRMEKLPEAANV